jgi:hypothetical protein
MSVGMVLGLSTGVLTGASKEGPQGVSLDSSSLGRFEVIESFAFFFCFVLDSSVIKGENVNSLILLKPFRCTYLHITNVEPEYIFNLHKNRFTEFQPFVWKIFWNSFFCN